MSKTKGLSLKQIEKALKKGKEIEYYHKGCDEWRDVENKWVNYEICIKTGHIFRIKPKKKKLKKVVLYGSFSEDFDEYVFDCDKFDFDTHTITFRTDENNKPILDSVKLREV